MCKKGDLLPPWNKIRTSLLKEGVMPDSVNKHRDLPRLSRKQHTVLFVMQYMIDGKRGSKNTVQFVMLYMIKVQTGRLNRRST